MFNFIDIYSFIFVSVCVGMDPSALLFSEVYNAVYTALITWCKFQIESDIFVKLVVKKRTSNHMLVH
jgi:hypothetical protein